MNVREPQIRLSYPPDVDQLNVAKKIRNKKQEYFAVAYLNAGKQCIGSSIVTIGLVDKCVIHPRELFAPAIQKRCSAIVLMHNHPSGSLTPSEEDGTVTRRMVTAGELLGIPVLDHVILTKQTRYSFLENGRI